MSQRCHYLPGNKSNEQPNNIVWFDTETKHRLDADGKQYHYLWFGWACYQRRSEAGTWEPPIWFRFGDIGDFWAWILSRTRDKTRLYLMSHNGAFDLPVLSAFTELPARGYRLTSAVADAPPLILTWRKGSRTIKYVDTLNIWRMPLAKVGESIGIPKREMPPPEASRGDWDAYGRQDVEVIRQATLRWLTFLRANDLGGFSPTLASQAFKAYRHRFMPCKILIDGKPKAAELARDSYLGGRVECFKIGRYQGEFYYLDINSMYPSVMRDGLFPVRLLGVYGRPTFDEIDQWLRTRCVICECVIETSDPIYPVVFEGKLIFPVGRFRAVLAGPELECAVRAGHVVSMAKASVYERNTIFRGFVDFMYDQRLKAKKAGNTVDTWLFKIMANSLYGKFGQRGRRFEQCGTCEPNVVQVWSNIDHETREITHFRQFGGVTQEWINEGEGRESFPAIASYVTAYARQVLWTGIVQAGRKNCLYCDTDSLVVNRAGFDRLVDQISDVRLGAWALERQLSDITLYGPKDYIFDGDQKVKGVRHNARWLSESLISQDYFVGFKGLLREASRRQRDRRDGIALAHGDPDMASKMDAPIVYTIEKNLRREYTKGTVSRSGEVSPLRLTYRQGGDNRLA